MLSQKQKADANQCERSVKFHPLFLATRSHLSSVLPQLSATTLYTLLREILPTTATGPLGHRQRPKNAAGHPVCAKLGVLLVNYAQPNFYQLGINLSSLTLQWGTSSVLDRDGQSGWKEGYGRVVRRRRPLNCNR